MIVRDEYYIAPRPRQVQGFGFITDIINGVSTIVNLVTGGGKPATQPAPPSATIVNIPPPPPEGLLETPGGVLAVLGGTAVVGLLIYTLGKD